MTDFDLNISSLLAAYRKGLSPVEVVDAVYRRIEAADDPGIFITLIDRTAARGAAERLGPFDPGKPLWGVPFAVKDNIDVAGLPTTAGCPDFAYDPAETAPAVELLLAAGAILIGKTNLDQFATGLVGLRTPYPIPRNAIDPDIVPGGSSAGSAVAVARGIVSFALGTDTAGSGRVPAALNNIVGLKPSLGMISTRGIVPACRTLDCISIFALTVDDAWRAFGAMARLDRRDPYSRPVALGAVHSPPTLRIGIADQGSVEFFGDKNAERAFRAHLGALEALGAQLVEIDLRPFSEVAKLLYSGPWVAERHQAIRSFLESHADALHPVTRGIIVPGAAISACDAFAGFYRLAELKWQIEPVWREIDVLAVPSVPTVYTVAEVEEEPIHNNARLGTYTNFVNLLDLCALAVPGAFRQDGRPAGLTLISPCGRDGLLAGLGEMLHLRAGVMAGATGRPLPEPPHRPLSVPCGWSELAVLGAHMSGLPLNPDLLRRGAVFVRKAATANCYRLFALPGQEPRRPGLLRVDDGWPGASIEIEVWALSAEAFGSFLNDVPPPLSIGTLLLNDGTRIKGFLVEAAGTVGAQDVSHYGGWRAYLTQTGESL
jgi:allophanate hydrolase